MTSGKFGGTAAGKLRFRHVEGAKGGATADIQSHSASLNLRAVQRLRGTIKRQVGIGNQDISKSLGRKRRESTIGKRGF
jgi:hypothetical protein